MSETPKTEHIKEGAFFDAARRVVDNSPEVPTRDELRAFVESLPLAGDGSNRSEITAEQRDQLVELLGRYGLLAKPLDEEKRARHVAAAQKLIDSGDAQIFLANRRMVDVDPMSLHRVNPIILSRQPIYFDPNNIVAASGFSSWQGRGQNGTGEVQHRGTGEHRPSIDAIYDYATQPTEFPPIGIDIIIEKDGRLLLRTTNDHRVAAAKLRNEPIAVNWITLLEQK